MADVVTRFEADEGVSRANFNSRIDEMNNGLAELKKTADAAKAITDTKGQAGGLAALGENKRLFADATAAAALTVAQVRNIYAGTTAMTAGTTALTNGVIYLQYE